MRIEFVSIAVSLTAGCVFAGSVQAGVFPIAAPGTEGLSVVVSGQGDVIATYLGNSASNSNDLYLMLDSAGNPGDDGDFSNDLFIFNNHNSPVGQTVNLGSFAIGTELILRLDVNAGQIPGERTYFSGPGTRNPDDHEHARVQGGWQANTSLVSFEDLLNGPFDYNDLSFSFTNTDTVPEPTSIALLGLAGLALLRRRTR